MEGDPFENGKQKRSRKERNYVSGKVPEHVSLPCPLQKGDRVTVPKIPEVPLPVLSHVSSRDSVKLVTGNEEVA